MDAELTDIAGRMDLVTGTALAPIPAVILVLFARLRAGMAALRVTGADHGAIAATRHITAGCPAAAGNKSRLRRAHPLADSWSAKGQSLC